MGFVELQKFFPTQAVISLHRFFLIDLEFTIENLFHLSTINYSVLKKEEKNTFSMFIF